MAGEMGATLVWGSAREGLGAVWGKIPARCDQAEAGGTGKVKAEV